MEQWNIKPIVNTWSTDDTQKILWNEKALDNIYKKLPASNLFTPSTSYGISTISTSPVVSLSSLSTVVFHPDWEQGYEIHVSFATVLDEIRGEVGGKIIFEVEESSSQVSCEHSDCKGTIQEDSKSFFLNIGQATRPKRSNSKPIPINSSNEVPERSKSESLVGSPRYPVFNRRRTKSTNSSRNLSISPGADLIGAFAGSLQESLLSGHMSTKKIGRAHV